jgi:hypothetical protein
MPITPMHIIISLILYLFLGKFITVGIIDLLLLLSAELIDLDHLFSKPIYHPKRNPFKNHFLHKNYIIMILVSLILVSMRPTLFLGIGLLSHLILDYIYVQWNRL